MGFLDSMFGGGESSVDNSAAFAQFAQAMRDRAGAYNPWVNVGSGARDTLYGQFNNNIANPNAIQDQVASGFYESPYQKYMQDMVTKRMNYNSTNTGMLGSGAANRALMDELTKMTGQFQNDYINRGMGTYGQALTGLEGLTNLGFQSMGAQDNLYEQGAAGDLQGSMSRNQYEADQAANKSNMWGNLFGTGLGAVAGGMFGGPQGAMNGAQFGRSLTGGGNTGGTAPSTSGMNLPTNWNIGSWSY